MTEPAPYDPSDFSFTAQADRADAAMGDLTPGSKADCPDCGKTLTVTSKGVLRSHKCELEPNTTPTLKGTGKRGSKAPTTKVRNLGIAVISSTAEYSAQQLVGRYVPCDPNLVPADMGPNAAIMVGPIVDLLWPTIPKQTQKLIIKLAEESDLIACAIAWARWGKGLQDFAIQGRKLAQEQEKANGSLSGTSTGRAGGRVIPFEPVTSTS